MASDLSSSQSLSIFLVQVAETGCSNALRLNPKFLFDCFLRSMLNVFGSKIVLQTPNKVGLNIAKQNSDYELCG